MNDRQVRAPDPSFDVGSVIGRSYKRHRAIESRRFLDKIDANVPSPRRSASPSTASSHKTKLIQDWLARRPRHHLRSP
jgi:hypothetical protein